MRTRLLGIAGVVVLVLSLMAMNVSSRLVGAQQATPEATPVATEETPADATPATTSSDNIVTLTAWYSPDEENDLLKLTPVDINARYETSEGVPTASDLTGTVNFDESRNKGGLPRIRLGNSIFDAVELVDGDRDSVQRWFFYNDEDGARPATLVMQVTAKEGPYEGATGTATFISRADDSTGVLVIVLYLPES